MLYDKYDVWVSRVVSLSLSLKAMAVELGHDITMFVRSCLSCVHNVAVYACVSNYSPAIYDLCCKPVSCWFEFKILDFTSHLLRKRSLFIQKQSNNRCPLFQPPIFSQKAVTVSQSVVTSFRIMSGWAAYLPAVAQVSAGSAIVSLQGARCGTMGSWAASQAEEVKYAQLITNTATAQAQGLTYAGKKFIVTRVMDDTIMAQLGKEGLVIQKANTVLVAAHFKEGQVVNTVSAKLAYVVKTLTDNGV